MRDTDYMYFRLLSNNKQFQRKLQTSMNIVDEALSLNRHGYVAFSGGVDSTVVLDIVLARKPDFPVFWIDDGADYKQTLQFVKDTKDRYTCNMHYIRGVKRGDNGAESWTGLILLVQERR